MKKILAILMMLVSMSVFAADCEDKTPFGYPTTAVETTLLCRKQYVVEYYNDCKTPLLVIEHLTADMIGGTDPRSTFHVDPDLPANLRATLADYAGRQKLGIDIGHMAPAADFKTDTDAEAESFNISNAVPQAAKMNRGIWRMLEIRVRALAVKNSDVWVMTGAIFNGTDKIGSGVCRPTSMYKVVIDTKTNESIAWHILNDNSSASKKFNDFVTTAHAVEGAAVIDLTPKLDVSKANKLKTTIGKSLSAN